MANIKLRPWNERDEENLAAIANNPNIAAFLTNQFPQPYSLENAKAFIQMACSHNPPIIQAVDLNDMAIGAIGIHPQEDIFCKNAELGYWLAEEHWGKGFITEAIKLKVRYAFNNFDLTRIFARPFSHNIGSIRVLEKSGFQLEGAFDKTIYKDGHFYDELVYATRR